MKNLRFRIGRLALALGAATVCWACNAPFIPVPPPGQTASFTSALVADGVGGQKKVWIAHGEPFAEAASARFYIFDTNRMAGVIAEAASDGSYTAPPLDGALGDRVEISYETTAGALSTSTCFQLTDAVKPAPGCQPP